MKKINFKFLCFAIFGLLSMFIQSCSKPKTYYLPLEMPQHVKTILVLPWDTHPSRIKDFFPSPVKGIIPGPIESYALEIMNELFKKELINLKALYRFVFLSSDEVEILIEEIGEKNKTPQEVLKTLAQKTGTDAILYGKIYRFIERKGRGFAVDEPASVAFILVLYDGKTGHVIWHNFFDETQKPLSENLLNLSLYGKIKWLTAKELAERGLNRAFKNFPK